MSAPRPKKLPTFATDANYAAPGHAWDGSPLRTEPPARNQGFSPTQRPAADYVNWLAGVQGEWLSHLAELPLRNWFDRSAAFIAAESAGVTALRRSAYDAGFDGNSPQVLSIGAGGGGNKPPAVGSVDGEYWFDCSSGVSGTNYEQQRAIYVAGGGVDAWVMVGGITTTGKIHTHARDLTSGSWTSQTPGATNVIYGVAHLVGALYPVAVVGAGGHIQTCASGGDITTWVPRSSPTGNDLTCVVASPSVYVAVGASGTIVSSSDGITWTARTSGTGTAFADVAWEPRLALFVAVTTTGVVKTSPDGATWNTGTPVPCTLRVDTLNTDGQGTIIAGETTSTGTHFFYSTDGGASWSQRIWVFKRVPDVALADFCFCGPLGWIAIGPNTLGTQFVLQSLRL